MLGGDELGNKGWSLGFGYLLRDNMGETIEWSEILEERVDIKDE